MQSFVICQLLWFLLMVHYFTNEHLKLLLMFYFHVNVQLPLRLISYSGSAFCTGLVRCIDFLLVHNLCLFCNRMRCRFHSHRFIFILTLKLSSMLKITSIIGISVGSNRIWRCIAIIFITAWIFWQTYLRVYVIIWCSFWECSSPVWWFQQSWTDKILRVFIEAKILSYLNCRYKFIGGFIKF